MTGTRRMIRLVRSLLAIGAFVAPWRRVTVFLVRPEAEIERLDIATGPLVAAHGEDRPMVSRWAQEDGLGPAQLKRLFRLLEPDRTLRPWASRRRAARASLYAFSEAFVARLIEIAMEADRLRAAEPPVKGRAQKTAQAERVLAPYTRVAERWLSGATWIYGMEVGGVRSIVVSLVANAKDAHALGQRLYGWYGPGQPKLRVKVRKLSDGQRLVETE